MCLESHTVCLQSQWPRRSGKGSPAPYTAKWKRERPQSRRCRNGRHACRGQAAAAELAVQADDWTGQASCFAGPGLPVCYQSCKADAAELGSLAKPLGTTQFRHSLDVSASPDLVQRRARTLQ